MKLNLKPIYIYFLLFSLIMLSCRTEEMVFIENPPENTLSANSNVATLMQRTSLNDGSNDNIVDQSNCFNIQFPYTVVVNGTEIIVNSDNDYEDIEDIFDEFDDDLDEIEITFPITIILSNFDEIIINNEDELEDYSDDCNDENEYDDDIECLDFQYPITASIFNTSNELIDTISITNDNELHDFIEDLNDSVIVSIDFPISIILADNTTLIINDITELENTISNYGDDCDEDDDYDYNDDDCDNCTTDELRSILINCSDWVVDKLERNDQDLEDNYIGYHFNFFSDGTIAVDWASITVYGTWTSSGTGNDLTVTIDLPDLPDCNAMWTLHEIDVYSGETKVDLRYGDSDRLRYESNCN